MEDKKLGITLDKQMESFKGSFKDAYTSWCSTGKGFDQFCSLLSEDRRKAAIKNKHSGDNDEIVTKYYDIQKEDCRTIDFEFFDTTLNNFYDDSKSLYYNDEKPDTK